MVSICQPRAHREQQHQMTKDSKLIGQLTVYQTTNIHSATQKTYTQSLPTVDGTFTFANNPTSAHTHFFVSSVLAPVARDA